MTLKPLACKYHSRGWNVIPIPYKEKKPTISWKEYQTQRMTDQNFNRLFNFDHGNIAIVTGKVSNLVVVDVDGPEGMDSLKDLHIMSPYTVLTGKGRHLYFKHPGNDVHNTARSYPGVDLRGDGGYVIAPPSTHASGRIYRWLTNIIPMLELPAFPVDLFTTSIPGKPEVNSPGWITEALEGLQHGNRNNTFAKVIGKLHRNGWNKEDIITLLEPHRESCEFPKREFYYEIESITSKYAQEIQEKPGVITPQDTVKRYIKEVGDTNKERKPEFPTGFTVLDGYTSGLRRGEIFTVAARTGIGKTSFATSVCRKFSERGHVLLLFSTEMSSGSIFEKFLSGATRISLRTLRLGRLEESDKQKVAEYYNKFTQTKVFICDNSLPTIDTVKDLTEEINPDIIVFDHIQHIGSSSQSVRQDISIFTRLLKSIAMKSNCAVLLLSQIRRLGFNKETGKQYEPTLSDLKESGTIEEESTVVLLLSEKSRNDECTILRANLAKNRYGPTGTFEMRFHRDTTTFLEG